MLDTLPQNELVTQNDHPTRLEIAGQVANRHAAAQSFDDYLARKSDATIRTHAAALAVFGEYLQEAGVYPVDLAPVDIAEELQHAPQAWRGMTWGTVAAFVRWMLGNGYAVSTVNNRLSVVKTYCKLASQAGAVTPQELQLIKTVTGYGQKEAKRVNERRDVVRVGAKKAHPVKLTADDARVLKSLDTYGDGPQAARDALLMCLLLDHGLRVSEVAGLRVSDFDLKSGKMTFYRPKVDKTQTHKLTADTMRAARAYFSVRPAHDAFNGLLLLGSRKSGELTDAPMSTRAITKRAGYLAEKYCGLEGLSAHDCRHYWATDAARNGTSAFSLQDAGGWSSLDMPAHYVESAKVANEGVKLTI